MTEINHLDIIKELVSKKPMILGCYGGGFSVEWNSSSGHEDHQLYIDFDKEGNIEDVVFKAGIQLVETERHRSEWEPNQGV